MTQSSRWLGLAAVIATLALLTTPLAAHDAHVVGPYRLEIGWGDEPAFSGIRNSVVVEITDAKRGTQIDDLGGGSLSVEVVFGAERTVVPLQPVWERRNELRGMRIFPRTGTARMAPSLTSR